MALNRTIVFIKEPLKNHLLKSVYYQQSNVGVATGSVWLCAVVSEQERETVRERESEKETVSERDSERV